MKQNNIGIITLPGNFNYGNRLQCYAMAEAVRQIGFNPFVLEREQPYSLSRQLYYSMKNTLLAIAGRQNLSPEKMMSEGRTAAFRRFSRYIPTVLLPGNGYLAKDEYYRLIVGSDQVWNPNVIAHQEDWFFAKFANPEQRIAVAASLGIDEFSEDSQSKRVAEGVKGFSHISVREKRGAELICSCTGVNPQVLCDPTITVSADKWRSISDGRLTPSSPYVLTYLLGGVGKEASTVLSSLSNNGQNLVIPLSDRQKPEEPDAGPAEFIDLIDHASHVVTDSFHAAVFSSILHTPLTIVHREGKGSMFSRLEQLADSLDLQGNIYGSPSYSLESTGDYKNVDSLIMRERDTFMNYLKDCLDV